MEKINDLIDPEIKAVKKQIEEEKKLAEEREDAEKHFTAENKKFENAIITRKIADQEREHTNIQSQIELEIEHLEKIKEQKAASEKHYKELIERIATAQAAAQDLIKKTDNAIANVANTGRPKGE